MPQTPKKPVAIGEPNLKICVSGAADSGHCAKDALEKAKEIGREIVRHNSVLVTGATHGAPYWAAIGAKEEGGFSIGLSPAASFAAHTKTYRLPTDYFDIIVYTGFEYSGRNLLLTRSSDAIVVVCGRMGTLNEFTIAFEEHKPIGILEGTGGTADMVRDLVRKMHRGAGTIIYDRDPHRLIKRLCAAVRKNKQRSEKVEKLELVRSHL